MNQDAPALVPVFILGAIFIGFIITYSVTSQRERARKELERERQREARRAYIRKKYDADTADRILRRNVWTGETAEQLRDSLGSPADVDQKLLKTKKK